MSGIFISYRREDSAGWAGRLAETLKEQFGPASIFMDLDGIELGTDFTVALHRALESCDVLLAMIGPEWATITDKSGTPRIEDPADWVRIEITAALKRNIRVISVLVGGAAVPTMDQMPGELDPLANRQAHELTDKRWNYDVEQLIRTFPGTLRKPWGIPHFQLAPATPVIVGGLVIAVLVVVWATFSSFYAPLPSSPTPSRHEVQTLPEVISPQQVLPISAVASALPVSTADKPVMTFRVGQEAHLKDHVTSCVYKVLAAQAERARRRPGTLEYESGWHSPRSTEETASLRS